MARSSTIVIIAVLASCILLATAVPVNSNIRGLKSVATAQEDGSVGKQEPVTAAGYDGKYREEQHYEEKRYDDHDDEKQYYGERPSGPDYYHHQEDDYPKVEAKHLCLQESGRASASGLQTSTFRCCAPGDKPDACVEPAEYEYDTNRDDHHELDFIGSLAGNPPATCTWKTTGNCPSWTESCFGMELNCTVSSSAGDCGCPYKQGFMFRARGYVAKIDAKGCAQEYEVPASTRATGRRLAAANYATKNETYYTGDAWIFRGKINMIATTGGYREAKGMVEFVTDFQNGVAVNKTHGYGGYRHHDDDSSYGHDDDRSYGHDDERHYGHDDDHNYGHDDRKYGHDDDRSYGHDNERDYHEREHQYGDRDRSGPYEAKAQGYHDDDYSGVYDRPWLKAGNMKITLYETEYY